MVGPNPQNQLSSNKKLEIMARDYKKIALEREKENLKKRLYEIEEEGEKRICMLLYVLELIEALQSEYEVQKETKKVEALEELKKEIEEKIKEEEKEMKEAISEVQFIIDSLNREIWKIEDEIDNIKKA